MVHDGACISGARWWLVVAEDGTRYSSCHLLLVVGTFTNRSSGIVLSADSSLLWRRLAAHEVLLGRFEFLNHCYYNTTTEEKGEEEEIGVQYHRVCTFLLQHKYSK